jgi:hypothetical protein
METREIFEKLLFNSTFTRLIAQDFNTYTTCLETFIHGEYLSARKTGILTKQCAYPVVGSFCY